MLESSFSLAAQSALALAISHGVCCGIVMHFDLTGKWAKYTLHKTRCVSTEDYIAGAKSFIADLVLLFLPFMTICYYFREKEILGKYAGIFNFPLLRALHHTMTHHLTSTSGWKFQQNHKILS